ncbi:hypothetical protein S820908_074 [Synechococcus phage S-CAM9]|uniref:Uncharacterized protein n=2 Tax=Synechococcus phage S-CAM9 TaxID=1883369 RepID=A0A1D8KNJ6_9CAUD|nr:hypothetical protein S050808_075 [Synechococcus phage S-CAM9]AOV60449.1 hypothetical protein S820908_074 [Synechococcus phage S-CAM9]
MYKKVEGHSELIRDMDSGAVINNDTTAYQNYIAMREQKIKEKQRLENLENEVGEIKSLLKEMLNKLN